MNSTDIAASLEANETERRAEVEAIPVLTLNLSASMRSSLTIHKIAANFRHYRKSNPEAIQPFMCKAAQIAKDFQEWWSSRDKKLAIADNPDVHADLVIYVKQKIWDAKVESGRFFSEPGKVVAPMLYIQRDMRARMAEAVNRAIKAGGPLEEISHRIVDDLDVIIQRVNMAFYVPAATQLKRMADESEQYKPLMDYARMVHMPTEAGHG